VFYFGKIFMYKFTYVMTKMFVRHASALSKGKRVDESIAESGRVRVGVMKI